MLHFLLLIVCMLVIRHFSPPLFRFLSGMFTVIFFLILLGAGFVFWAATHECEFDRLLGNPPSEECVVSPRRSGAVAPRRQSGDDSYGAAAERWRRRSGD